MPDKFSTDSDGPKKLKLLTKAQLGVPRRCDEPLDVVRRGALENQYSLKDDSDVSYQNIQPRSTGQRSGSKVARTNMIFRSTSAPRSTAETPRMAEYSSTNSVKWRSLASWII